MGHVDVKVPASLRAYWGGGASARVEARSLREAIRGLGPLADRVLDEAGRARPHVHLFVNHAPARDLDAPLAPGDIIHILPAVSGGSRS